MRTVDVNLPDEPYIDHESIAASEAFREFVRSREYAKWAKKERQKWEQRNPDKVAKCRATDWSRR